jgi:hypothetical protein
MNAATINAPDLTASEPATPDEPQSANGENKIPALHRKIAKLPNIWQRWG